MLKCFCTCGTHPETNPNRSSQNFAVSYKQKQYFVGHDRGHRFICPDCSCVFSSSKVFSDVPLKIQSMYTLCLSKTKICANLKDLFKTICNYGHLKTWGLNVLRKKLVHSCLFSLLQMKNLHLLHWGAICIHIQLWALFGSGVACFCHPRLSLRFLSQNLWLIPLLINKTLVGCELWPVIVLYCPIFSCFPWHGFSWWWLIVFHHIQAQCRGNNLSHKRGKRPSCF